MRIRLLTIAAVYAAFLLLLFLFPPFHDGHHHFYSFRPAESQIWSFVPPWVDSFGERGWSSVHLSTLSAPDPRRIVLEAAIGLAVSVLLFLLFELVALFRGYRKRSAHLAKSGFLNFFFIVE